MHFEIFTINCYLLNIGNFSGIFLQNLSRNPYKSASITGYLADDVHKAKTLPSPHNLGYTEVCLLPFWS